MSGASASWHDLVLYLVARHVGPTAAQALAKFLLLQWHTDGQGPYVPFDAPLDHGDAIVADAQEWLRTHYAVAAPVTELVERSGLPERTFKRRFTSATGYSPIAYVQHVRVEEAKRRLERTAEPVDAISYAVGYEDPASFRRLFKRITGVTPGAYRRKLQLPAFARQRPRRAGRSVLVALDPVRQTDPAVPPGLPDRDRGRPERGIGEDADGHRDELGIGAADVVDGGAAVGAERERPRLAVVGDAHVVARLPGDLDALAREARLVAEGAARAPLAGEAVADRDPDRIALGGEAELAAAAGGLPSRHGAEHRPAAAGGFSAT